MSKSYLEQVEIFRETRKSERAAREVAIVCNCHYEDDDGRIIIDAEFARVVKAFKKQYKLTKLLSISARMQKTRCLLEYTMYSEKTKSEMTLYIYIKDHIQSISHLYDNADELENELDDKYNIVFYPAK